ncbi:alpha-galactosidase [Oxalobacteraceae bacterium GrIS 2.11]
MQNNLPASRRAFLQWMSSTPLLSSLSFNALAAQPDSSANSGKISDGVLLIEFNQDLHSRISCTVNNALHRLTQFAPADTLELENGQQVRQFKMTSAVTSKLDGEQGQMHLIQGVSKEGIQKSLEILSLKKYPGLVLYRVRYRNLSSTALKIKSWTNAACAIEADASGKPAFWSFSGGTYQDRRDALQPVKAGFNQANFMGMNATDYGGGTPVIDIWRPDCGLAIGHIELAPKLVSLPIERKGAAVHIAMYAGHAAELAPGEELTTHETFLCAHAGDYFQALNTYRQVMADRGIQMAAVPEESYQPIWCAWGYERNFSLEYVAATLPKVKELGLEWAVIDDGWQTANGDWYVDKHKFPRGEEDLKALVKTIGDAGLKSRLWYCPLAVNPGTDLLHDHTDMLLLDADGAVQNISWWNSFYLCPAYAPTVEYTKALVRKMLGEWGFAGLKIDGQHLNGVAPCFNPAHHHARPEESVEKLQEFFHAIYQTAMEVNPHAVIEICPCGTEFAFHNMPYMNQTPASDPLSSWQVRLKGKTFKALMGPAAPFAGDHVELSEHGDDFASTVGVGGVVSTKFTWPVDPKPKDSFLLTPEKDALWHKWIALYNQKMLPTGQYRGDLYDIGFDKPEGHVVIKGEKIYYAFYADSWRGAIALRGLGAVKYRVRDYYNDLDLGVVSAASNRISHSFERALLLEVTPIEVV